MNGLIPTTASLQYMPVPSNNPNWNNVGNLQSWMTSNGYKLGGFTQTDMFKVEVLDSSGELVGELHIGQTVPGPGPLRVRDHVHPQNNPKEHIHGDDDEYGW